LNVAKISGEVIGRDLATWLATISDKLHKKLAAVDLVAARSGAAGNVPTLAAFLADFIAKRTGSARPGTIASMKGAAARLTDHFGDDVTIDAINSGQADEWLLWMTSTKKYAGATIGRTVKRARQFFRAAVRLKLLQENVFADLKAPGQTNESRNFYVTPEVAAQVLDALPDVEWRLIFALSRFGGLRCPSEHLPLTWPDIDWARDRFLVRSPKTGDRWVPIFAELRPYLAAAFEAAHEGTLHVISRRRDSAQRWGTLLDRILSRAGIKRWERLFHNLRASRQTELTARFSIGTVCRWLGNSISVADQHYLTAMETEFERAAKEGAIDCERKISGAVQKQAQQTEANGDEQLQTTTADRAKTLKYAGNAKKFPEACKSQGG
jgi:site-specific recombinase XerD